MRATLTAASLLSMIIIGSPAKAEKLTLETTPLRIQVVPDVFIMVGGSLDVNRIDFAQDRVNLDADFRVYTRKKDLEDFVFQKIKASKPIPLKYFIDIRDVYRVTIDPQPDGFHVSLDAEFGNNWKSWRDRVSAVVDSKSLTWAVAQSLVRIVPNSLNFQYPDYFKWAHPEGVIENVVQEYMNSNLDKNNIRGLFPVKMDLSNLAFAYDKSSTRIAFQGHARSQFDKPAFEAQFAGFLADHMGALGSGESAGLRGGKASKPGLFKVVGSPN